MASGMTMPMFEVGRIYAATGVMRETSRSLVICTGRQGEEVCFAFCDGFATANARSFPGLDREFVHICGRNGHMYNVSAALPLDGELVTQIAGAMMKGQNHD